MHRNPKAQDKWLAPTPARPVLNVPGPFVWLRAPQTSCTYPALQELAHQDIIRQLKLEHAKEITKLRQEFELQARELQQKYEKKMKMLRDDMELRRKQVGPRGRPEEGAGQAGQEDGVVGWQGRGAFDEFGWCWEYRLARCIASCVLSRLTRAYYTSQEIHEIEERKNTHINELMKKHERAFAEIKNYYNDITHNNLDLIKTLKVRHHDNNPHRTAWAIPGLVCPCTLPPLPPSAAKLHQELASLRTKAVPLWSGTWSCRRC